MGTRTFRSLLVIALLVLSESAWSFVFFGEGLFPPLQIPAREESVYGFRINPGWAAHGEMKGGDFNLIGGISDKEFAGFAFSGVFNRNYGKTQVYGIQAAGLLNLNQGESLIVGLQLALGANVQGGAGSVYGFQVSGIGNWAEKMNVYGGQSGMINRAKVLGGVQLGLFNTTETMAGFQLGMVNSAKTVYGFQIGLWNSTDNLHGIQLGLVNLVSNGPIKFLPVFNIGI